MTYRELIQWLQKGDVSIRYQVFRDLLSEDRKEVQQKIQTEGWGAQILKLSYPGRWRYDILRALDYFRMAGSSLDSRMEPAFKVLATKRRKDGTWTSSKHPGQIHFEMEQGGRPSRWNTLRTLRVLNHFNKL